MEKMKEASIKNLTKGRLEYILAVKKVCEQNGIDYATPSEVARVLQKDSGTVKAYMHKMAMEGWFKVTGRGMYSLSDKTREILKEVLV